jgi:hypothetical protein
MVSEWLGYETDGWNWAKAGGKLFTPNLEVVFDCSPGICFLMSIAVIEYISLKVDYLVH